MMVKRIGVDIVSNTRIAKIYNKHGEKFARRILTEKELELFRLKNEPISFLAGRWAAKEAVSKALSKGFQCGIRNIEILNDSNGVPIVKLYSKAKIAAEELGITRIEISISHERKNSVAFVVTL